jgi:hypothetical protein
MADGLTGGGTIIDADVEAGRGELGLELLLGSIQQLEHCCALFRRGVEERFDVPQRDHQSVPSRHRKRVSDNDGGIIAKQFTTLRQATKQARHGHEYPVCRRRFQWANFLDSHPCFCSRSARKLPGRSEMSCYGLGVYEIICPLQPNVLERVVQSRHPTDGASFRSMF